MRGAASERERGTHPHDGDLARDPRPLCARLAPRHPPVDEPDLALLGRVDEELWRDRMVLDVVHAAHVGDGADEAGRGAHVEVVQGAVGRGREEEVRVVRVRRKRHDGVLSGVEQESVQGVEVKRGERVDAHRGRARHREAERPG